MSPLPISSTKDSLALHQDLATLPLRLYNMLNCGRLCQFWVSARETDMLPLPISSTKDGLDLHQDLAITPHPSGTIQYAKLWEALP